MSKNNSLQIPDPNVVFPNEYKTSCFVKNVITAPNITVGDYTYYDDAVDPTGFEKNNVLFNYPVFGDKLIIGKFCQLASGTKFIMGPANHRLCSATTYPFNVFGGAWTENTPPHLDQLPHIAACGGVRHWQIRLWPVGPRSDNTGEKACVSGN
ncbi:MAG TPA: hypothetical protein H9850_05450 [Candidatus Anaerobiospirillum pullistercoris]|uniref:Chloramphenicol acetyltransferase n=1 Tax=Candidatus Anaerobiospirillum pullistercoris TaxID=2838452 RepID=A0A9D1WDG8_9GAMM|nr:hypothetical protein [Candidatus Anaerobiospirillum pullistercoris]